MISSSRFSSWDFYSRDQVARISPFEFEVTAPAGQAITVITPTGVEETGEFVPKVNLPIIHTPFNDIKI